MSKGIAVNRKNIRRLVLRAARDGSPVVGTTPHMAAEDLVRRTALPNTGVCKVRQVISRLIADDVLVLRDGHLVRRPPGEMSRTTASERRSSQRRRRSAIRTAGARA